MTPDRLRTTWLALEAFNARDADEFAQYSDEEIEWYPLIARTLEGPSFIGHAGIRVHLARLGAEMPDMRLDVLEMRDMRDRVLWFGRFYGRATDDLPAVDVPIAGVWDFRGAKILRICHYFDAKTATEVAGRHEQPAASAV